MRRSFPKWWSKYAYSIGEENSVMESRNNYCEWVRKLFSVFDCEWASSLREDWLRHWPENFLQVVDHHFDGRVKRGSKETITSRRALNSVHHRAQRIFWPRFQNKESVPSRNRMKNLSRRGHQVPKRGLPVRTVRKAIISSITAPSLTKSYNTNTYKRAYE